MSILHRYMNFVILVGGIVIPLTLSAAELKDPTRPPFYRADTAAEPSPEGQPLPDTAESWVLNSTLISSTQRLATINGMLLRKGDKIGSMTVVDIKPDKALLRVNSENVEVTLVRNNIKTEADKSVKKK